MKKTDKTNNRITLGGVDYPKNNTAVIMMGALGTKKKEVVEELLNIEGEVFGYERGFKDVLKSEKALNYAKRMNKLDIKALDMSDPIDITKSFNALSDHPDFNRGMPRELSSKIALSDKTNKPNLIFLDKVGDAINYINLSFSLTNKSYDLKDIHIVWMIEDYNKVVKRNKTADGIRYSDLMLESTHKGIADTMESILTDPSYNKYMDGDIWIILDNNEKIRIKEAGKAIDRTLLTPELMEIIERYKLSINPKKNKTSKKEKNREIRERLYREQKQSDVDELWDEIAKKYY